LTFDLRTLDLAGFRRWLEILLARWQTDPVFAQRVLIRELRRAHPQLRERELARCEAEAADAATPTGVRLRTIERKMYNADRAIAGLTAALAQASDDEALALGAKREAFRARRQALESEREAVTAASQERQLLLRVSAELECLRVATGLDFEEARLADLRRQHGQAAGRAGSAFEKAALDITRQHILPDLPGDDLQLLHGVRLGAAGVELDQVVVRQPDGPENPVEVLAIVEAKRNINDLAHGFLRRQIDLAWLTGDTGRYDPSAHRTGHFTTGHFDRSAVHWQDSSAFVFAPGSFRHFARDAVSGHFLNGVYLVSRAGPIVGLSSAARHRIAARVASDSAWDLSNDEYVGRLFNWCRLLAKEVETPDVLQLFAARHTNQLLFVLRDG
jgi:hypothetical protein